MTEAVLHRFSDNSIQTLGLFTFLKPDGQIWVAKALELPYKNNLPNVSCIPEGEYKCVYTRSNRLSKLTGKDYYTYEILDVPDRTGIRIHSANFFHQLRGCVSLGSVFKDINIDGQMDVVHSGATVKLMEAGMNYEEFMLTIVKP